MPTSPDFNEAHVIQFTETVAHLSQQSTPRFKGAVMEKSCIGEQAQAVIQLGDGDVSALAAPTYGGGSYDGWYGDTAWDSIETFQRWIMPSAYKRALPIHKRDLVQMLTDPRSNYAASIVKAFNRRFDDTVIAAALGTAQTGRFDNMAATALPAGQKVAVGTSGLTIEKLLDAWELLRGAEVSGEDGEDDLYFATSAKGLRELLNSTEVKSSDYNTVKALAAGELDSFMGFKFIRSERLAIASGTPDVRSDFAFAKSGIQVGVWEDVNIRADERPDKNYTWQIYGENYFGATRTEEVKVVEVACEAS